MDIRFEPQVALSPSLKVNRIMIQRFNILQQSAQEFEDTLQEKSKKNPFIEFSLNRPASFDSTQHDNAPSPIDLITYKQSLLHTLINQLDAQHLSQKEHDIILTLIDHLDDRGLLPDYSSVQKTIMANFNVSKRYVFHCLTILQSFEPDGIGSRSINECLWNQVDQYGLDDDEQESHLKTIVKCHLDDIANNHDAILTALSIQSDQLDDYLAFIGHLNPVPSTNFSKTSTINVQPSLKVDIVNGILTITNVEKQRINIQLNQRLLEKVSTTMDTETKMALEEAKIWMAHYQKRQSLIEECGRYIINTQHLFFTTGPEYVLPCLQKNIAAALNVSQSTISRVVRTKYIEYSQGIILFKALCYRNIYGKTTQQVQRLVSYYCDRYPQLSDQKIAHMLTKIGLPIARRTVTKYRHNANQDNRYSRKLIQGNSDNDG